MGNKGDKKREKLPGDKSLQLTLRLLRRVKEHRGILFATLATMIIAAVAETAPIALAKVCVGVIFDSGINEPSGLQQWFTEAGNSTSGWFGLTLPDPRLAALWFIVTAVVVLGLVTALATFANTFFGRYMAALVVADLRCGLMRKILDLPVAFYTRRKIGDLVSRFSTDVQITYTAVNVFLMILVLQPIILLFAVTAAFILNWRLALTSIVILPLVILPIAMIGRKVRKRSRRSLVSLGESMEAVNQALSGLRVIKAFHAEDLEDERYRDVNRRWLRRQAALIRAKATGRGLMDGVYSLTMALALGLGGYLVITGKWDLDNETFAAFFVALATIYRPLKRLAKAYNDWQESMAAADRVFHVLDTAPEPADRPDAVSIGPITEGLKFEAVSFAYRGENEPAAEVLHELSFEIPAGKTVALVGPSGAGKSTVADLIFRFHHPDSGEILVDGVPIADIQRDSLLQQMAVVSQRPFLFNTTITENIAYGRRGASMEEIRDAARAAHIHDLIETLPEGYETVVGERGASLSGGQLQRVTIARAILRDASFLLLDEATSSLDTESERSVQKALSNLLEGRTALVIAHRLSTIEAADHILVINEGRIVEEGNHASLLDAGGMYSRLYRNEPANGHG